MALQSINGKLFPSSKWFSDNNLTQTHSFTHEYAGHFLNVSFRHVLNDNIVFSKERIAVEDNGEFVFLVPDSANIEDQIITLKAKAPDGELLSSITASVGKFLPVERRNEETDESKEFIVKADPKSVSEIATTKIQPKTLKLKGRVIDINGKASVSNLQIVLWAAKENIDGGRLDTSKVIPIYSGKTDKNGYFFGEYPVSSFTKIFGVVAGMLEEAIELQTSLENDYTVLQTPIILALDFEKISIDTEDCSCHTQTPELPNSNALVESSGSFSQDLGGGCVDFTTPNRTLEEYSFFHVVRTTEPEIKGLTLTPKEARAIRKNLFDIFNKFNLKALRLISSLDSIQIKNEDEIEQMVYKKLSVDKGTPKTMNQPDSANPMIFRMVSNDIINAKTMSYSDLSSVTVDNKYGKIKGIGASIIPNARPSMLKTQLENLKKKRLENATEILKKVQKEINKHESSLGSSISLSEIFEYRELYNKLRDAMETFETLLDDYYGFYTSFNKMLFISDVFFPKNYSSFKTTIQDYIKDLKLRIAEIERIYALNHPGRRPVNVDNQIDWDDEPTIYQNTTIANGHLLHFKQQWKAAGYSLGDLLYSLPLAPCQKKQIAIFDWDRSESASRTEEQTNEERLSAHLSRDRDVSEIMNSAFSENIQASSSSKTKSKSGSIGVSASIPIYSALVGVSGGYSASSGSSSSVANQDASRNLSAESLNSLQDSVQQSAASIRSQRSTVVQSVSQGETFNVTTEVIANHNHCHSMTMEYFEVLRHIVIEQNLVGVSECLFVPLQMSMFNTEKVLRWKNNLRSILRNRYLLDGFDALERIANSYENSELQDLNGMYAEEFIDNFTGSMRMSFEFERPFIEEIEDNVHVSIEDFRETYRVRFGWISYGLIERIYKRIVITPWTEEEKDRLFEEEFASDIAREFIDNLSIMAIDDSGGVSELNLDITMVSKYKKGASLFITLNPSLNTPLNISRNNISRILIRSTSEVEDMSRIFLRSFILNYETSNLSQYLVNARNIVNDIVNTDAALLYTPLNSEEKVNPKKEDYRMANHLLEHLNEFLEFYHKQLWLRMDKNRLFGLLDGFIAPNSNGKSVASVAENKIIGITGNNLIIKVAPGYNLDPMFKLKDGVDLLDHYKPKTPADPFRISIPTRGIYAEAVMGQCNSCEKIDESRHWRFAEVSCGDEPTLIQPISTDSRRADPGNLQTKSMESPVVNIQNAPSAPDPTGLAQALDLMGKSGVFNDLTGLDSNQKNALAALQSAAKNTSGVIQVSKDLVKLAGLNDANRKSKSELDEIDRLEAEDKISKKDAQELRKKVLERKDKLLDKGGSSKKTDSDNVAENTKEILKAGGKNVEIEETDAEGNTKKIKASAEGQPSAEAYNDLRIDYDKMLELSEGNF